MTNRTAVKSKPSLNGMVFCAVCGSEMADTGRRYYCPNTTVDAGSSCNVSPTDAQDLLSSVVTRIANRLATRETVQRVTEAIGEITGAIARDHRRIMESSEAGIYDANAQRLAILHAIEDGAKTYEIAAAEIAELNRRSTGLAVESMVSRNELDKIEYINDVEGIQEAMTDPGTYLGGYGNEETQELLELLVGKVLVDSGSAKIVYRGPLPSDGYPEGIREDLVALRPTVTP